MADANPLAKYTNLTSLKGKTVMVTGASAGIGEACAWRFAAEGANLIVTARRKERLESLKAELEKTFGVTVHVLPLDMQDTKTIIALPGSLPKEFQQIDVLVNNAGKALGIASVDETLPEDIEGMIQTNVIGLMQMTTAISKAMKARGSGHIISIGSISGHFTYPGGSVYCASKFAVDGYMRAVQSDLVETPVRVSVVSPGFAETEFSMVRFKGDADKAAGVYQDIVALTAADCADSVLFAATRPAHVQIGEIVTWPTNQAVGGVKLARVGPKLGAAL
eukprot:CAMPEP_0182927054 /NCGR_PEP_ID=MMETSP0105_2-20130417/13037_1 /TAXON_ID=81532 ORGANISM="Acanthoeca-like sp., Strain 10tr" /NCGR_SAMPLE_ID=MMETSP0105_2 /ASSEMBLY_ACC=CAM_ASM_000205 /LENGTH=277 /DNA_ID=CAMNT_0025064981 /DNA_START=33 /DNA_END=866 /DNA_ORIENTATION=-